MTANPGQWVQRGNQRINNMTGEFQTLTGGNWTTDPQFTNGTNETLQNMYGFMKAPNGTSDYRTWALQNGWKEPSRNSGMTLGEALLKMGGMAFGAGALDGLGAGNDIASLMDMNAGAGALSTATGANGMGALDWLNADGSLNLSDLAAQDYADFGVDGVQALGDSLNYSNLSSLASAAGTSPGTLLETIKQYGGNIKSALSALGMTTGDAMKAIGALGSSVLGYMGSTAQTNALNAQSDKYMAMGQPYRDKLAALYADPSSFLKDPSVTTSVDQGTNALMRSLSTQGNPWGSGNALTQGQDYATKNLYSQLGAEKDRLAGFGGLTAYNNAAPQAATNAIQSSGNAYNAIGSGIGNIFSPPETAAQQMSSLRKLLGGGY